MNVSSFFTMTIAMMMVHGGGFGGGRGGVWASPLVNGDATTDGFVETMEEKGAETTEQKRGNLRRTTSSRIPPPNIKQAAYGYNVLLGMTPSEQRNALIGSKLFNLTGDKANHGNYIHYSQLQDLSASSSCVYKGITNEVWYSTSSSSLKTQASSSSSGFDQQVKLGAEIPVGTAKANVETTIRNALVFGNSKSSSNAVQQKSYGYTHSFDAKSRRSLYNVQMGYDANGAITTWTNDLKQACVALGNNPTTEQALNFFHEFGTHGLATAAFGQSCTSTMYMEQGETLSSYYTIHTETNDFERGMLWWTESTSSSESNQNGQSNANGFAYTIADRRCEGELVSDSSCGGGMQGSGRDEDRPAIIEWSYKPIWEMEIEELSNEAKDGLKAVFEQVLGAAVDCAENFCNSNGACAPNLERWGNIGPSLELEDLFDGSSTCFCLDDFVGNSCEIGRDIRFEPPRMTDNLNDWQGDLDYNTNNPICGMTSNFYGKKDDRQFQLSICSVEEPANDYGLVLGSQTIRFVQYDEPFTMTCEDDKVMVGLYSHHNTNAHDRIWTATCNHYKNTKTNNCDDYPSAYVNEYKENVDYMCPVGKVLSGIHAIHSNKNEDRRWKFRCCELQVTEDPPFLLSQSGWTSYINDFHEPSLYAPVVPYGSGNQAAAICAVSSYHTNSKEDRRYKYKSCFPPYAVQSSRTYSVSWSQLDEVSEVECPDHSFISEIESEFSKGAKDRSFRYKCNHFAGHATDMCYWTPEYVNDFDQEFDFECGSQFVLTGMHSYHKNKHEDRRFKFKCCRLTMGE